jgi:hypothetical protein
MISPSTIASAMSGMMATFVSSGSPRPWSMTATLIRPEPMSRPIVVFFRPKSAIARGAESRWIVPNADLGAGVVAFALHAARTHAASSRYARTEHA